MTARVFRRLSRTLLRTVAAAGLALAVVAASLSPASADTTTGVLSGTIRTSGGAGVAGATIVVAAPSGSRSAKTDARGFYSFTGLTPDTYTVSVSASGYSDVVTSGVNVSASQTTTFSTALSAALKTIGRISARSSTSAFQPTQTQDTYTINEDQINTILGNQFNNNETALISALPGASLDSSGYPVLRGGRENEEGFQFDGIDYTDAFTSQFVNSLALNGQSSFQLTPGAGDASTGNAGTGAINIVVKRGAYPQFGTFDAEAGTPAFNHQLSLEYGFASPNGRFSDYVSIIDSREAEIYGYPTADLVAEGNPQPDNYNTGNDIVNNFVYKFGKDNSQQVQLLYQNEQYDFFLQSAPGTQFNFRSNDPVELDGLSVDTGLSPTTLGGIYGLDFGQTSATQTLASVNRSPGNYYQPNQTFKLQYSRNINDSTFLTAKFYRVQSVTTFDFPYSFATNGNPFYDDFYLLQGGQRTGESVDLTKQVGSKNLITAGVKNEFLHPVYNYTSPSGGLLATLVDSTPAGIPLLYDFVPASNPDCAGLVGFFGVNPCGYLSKYFPKGIPRIPQYVETTATDRQDLSYYLNDSYTASARLKVEGGLRLDSSNYQLPAVNSGAYLPASGNGYSSGYYLPVSTNCNAAGICDPSKDVYAVGGNAVKNPYVVEPRLAAVYTFRPTDSIRASYGRSVELVPLGDIDDAVERSAYSAFTGVPATASVCGPTGNRACQNYADELFWANANTSVGPQIQPAKPATFNNFDFSYSHDFGDGVSVKLNPFYRRGYDGLARVSTPLLGANGQPIVLSDGELELGPPVTTNDGLTYTTGAEFYLTKEAKYGLSGSLSATYINEFSNVIPGSSGEDFFPSIPTPSLALGNLYRVGFVSPFNVTLAAAYKTRSGFKFSPNIYYNRGYPYGTGNITAIYVNGQPYNVPQTNVSIATTTGSNSATNYVDPQNPGTVFAPNIAATRGTPEAASAGGYLTSPRVTVNLDFEWSPPGSNSTFGVQVFNLFNNIYAQPTLNNYYQPVATGISGPATGTNPLTAIYGPNLGFANYGPDLFGTSAYNILPSNTSIHYQFYYQMKL
jgi:hypothetical protein